MTKPFALINLGNARLKKKMVWYPFGSSSNTRIGMEEKSTQKIPSWSLPVCQSHCEACEASFEYLLNSKRLNGSGLGNRSNVPFGD